MPTSLATSFQRWLVPAIFAVSVIGPAHAAPTVERTRKGEIAPTTRSVRVDHRSGPVSIVGVDSDFGWTWTTSCAAGSESQGQAYLDGVEMDVKETAGTLQLELMLPERHGTKSVTHTILGLVAWSHHESVNFRSQLELRLPRAVAVDLKNRFGTTKIAALSGPLNVDCQNGRVELDDLSGNVTATTSFAHLHGQNLGQARLRNQNGNVDVSDVRGDLSVTTSFGRMEVRRVKGRLDVKNQNGGIELEGVEGRVLAATSFARLAVHEVTGDADLKNQNGEIDARAISGDVVAATSFASLRVTDVGGKAALSCQNGRIEATRVGNDLRAANSFAALRAQEIRGRADLDSQNGDIVATGVDGDLHAKTSFARMELDAASKHIDARNQNGPVHIIARSPSVERIAASATFAPIDLRLADKLQPLIRASTSFGKVRSEYPVLLADSMADARFYAETAQTKIDLRGQNGDIRIQALPGR
jgi:hypothetical protein